MTEKKGFLARKNIEFSLQRYFIDALGAMALGLFASLIVGLILSTAGEQLANLLGPNAMFTFLQDIGGTAMGMMGPAIGVAVAYGLGAPPLVLFASAITGSAGAAVGVGAFTAGPAGSFIAAVIGAEFGKMVSKETRVDIIVTPAVTIAAGILAANTLGPPVASFMAQLGELIMWATELQPIPMGIIVAVLMGLALTAPISSAAIAIIMQLSGLAAGAATVGCAAQMVGFAVASYKENGWGGLLSQGVGTSMLQIPNIAKNPWILVPPTLAAAIIGPLATTIFRMENIPAGAGMGTSGFVGQFGTATAMGFTTPILLQIILLHFFLPAILAYLFAQWLRNTGKIKDGDYKLDL
ncbi:PTS transporter subunit IIC [Dethiobacter alkaliphilus]|uniref:PTS transporter subunit IIC n=1 Tax=Dethiobacter alkaliphilus TaxID=427926 RepID=UPI0022280D21|nr:PTS sugar transporter subunit IIC [Dethiobacter alkaliphilus]MCW3489472.1 PTS sugar transporter subunit IIC [Dethiobacter alkaliphilus]